MRFYTFLPIGHFEPLWYANPREDPHGVERGNIPEGCSERSGRKVSAMLHKVGQQNPILRASLLSIVGLSNRIADLWQTFFEQTNNQKTIFNQDQVFL